MAQQYGTPEEAYRNPAVGAEQTGSGGGTREQSGHYGGATGQQTQTGRPPTQADQYATQTGQHPTQAGGQSGAVGPDVPLDNALTGEMRVALHDFVQSATACEWCADRCIDEGPEMAECIRLCRDVADLATINVQLISRDSIFGAEAARVFADAAEACAVECSRHSHRHCQECADVLGRAARSTRKMLASFGGSTPGMQRSGPQF